MQIQQEQQQKQIISQKMLESMEILQMSTEELSAYLKETALSNPVIELDNQPEKAPADAVYEKQIRKLEWLSNLDEQNRTYYQYDADTITGNDNICAATQEWDSGSLKNTIMQQLVCNGYSQKELDVFAYIAQCLDANGYFTMEIAELARQLSLTESECRRYLDIMKSLEPTGICASSLQECLLMQLKDQTGTALEKAIILEHLELLGKNQLPVIAKKLKVSIEKVKKASEHIRQLNPRPADGYGASGYIRYIEPDITVVKFENRFEILLNDYRCPVVHISKDYLQMLKSDCPKDVKNYLQKKISQAEQLSECISQRGNTLMELAEFLVDAQTGFFLNGEQALRPLGLRDAAQKLSIHESTVSRAVKNKYLQCCWGIYPLSFFFKRRAAGKEDINAAAYLIQKELAQIIAQEDKKHPFNDEKLADLLKAKGYGISRRTAAKYREAMGIANSRERKFF